MKTRQFKIGDKITVDFQSSRKSEVQHHKGVITDAGTTVIEYEIEGQEGSVRYVSIDEPTLKHRLGNRSTTIDRVQARKDGETMSTKELAEKHSISTAYAYKLRTGRA